MGLKLRRGRPPAVNVALPGSGASIRVRAATAFEYDRARYWALGILAGLRLGQDAAMNAAAVLGDDFRHADFTQKDWEEAACERLVLLRVTSLCAESWTGVLDEQGAALPLNEANLAWLLQDQMCRVAVEAVVQGAVHEVIAEGNGLPASRSGEAEAGVPIAPAVSAVAQPAPADGEA